MEDATTKTLEERGPLTGAELREEIGGDGFALWRDCTLSEDITVRRVGRRYLRLDRRVEGYARLSPSIQREFLTYCVVGLRTQEEAVEARTGALASHIAEVSEAKRRLADRIVADVGARVKTALGEKAEGYCVLLAGDIVYGMGHDAARSESSTGRMVRGSDIDLVVITEDEAPAALGAALDDAIYQEKYRLLNNPAFKEEIDYVVKPMARVREQIAFDEFKRMVSCKILRESVLIFGNAELHRQAMGLLEERGIGKRLAAMEKEAAASRERVEGDLLRKSEGALTDEELYLFQTTEESEEFE